VSAHGEEETWYNVYLDVECGQELGQVNDYQLDQLERGQAHVEIDVGHAKNDTNAYSAL
jgi:hypothetical protein